MTKLEMLKEIGVGLNCNKSDKQNEEDLKFAMKRSKATIEYAYNIFTKALQDTNTAAENIKSKLDKLKDDTDAFEDWLNDNYNAFDIFNKNGVELDEVVNHWERVCNSDAEEDMEAEFAIFELEV